MAAVELILMQRVEKLGQMGDVVRVKPGYARNYLLPQKMAMRANKSNREQFDTQRAQLEAQNLRRRAEAERLAERIGQLSVVIIRQASDSGSLYGSVSGRDIADGCTAGGLTVNRTQVVLGHPIKTLGLTTVRVVLHPEVSMPVTVNVARSVEEAEKQARGERIGQDQRKRTPRPTRISRRCSSPAPSRGRLPRLVDGRSLDGFSSGCAQGTAMQSGPPCDTEPVRQYRPAVGTVPRWPTDDLLRAPPGRRRASRSATTARSAG